MFCRNCGYKLMESDFNCPKCGVKAGELPGVNYVPGAPVLVSSTNNNSNKFPVWAIILLVILGIFALLFIGFIFLLAVVIATDDGLYTDEELANYVYVDGDKIPTLNKLVTSYELCELPSTDDYYTETVVTYSYCDSLLDDDALDEYAEELIDDYDYEEWEPDYDRMLVKESTDDGYIIVIDIDYDDHYIYYTKMLEE